MVRTHSERWGAWLQVQVSRHLREAGECAGPDGKGAGAEKLRAHWPGKASVRTRLFRGPRQAAHSLQTQGTWGSVSQVLLLGQVSPCLGLCPGPGRWGQQGQATSTSAQARVQEAQSPCFTGTKEDMRQVCFPRRALSAGVLQRAAVDLVPRQ